MKGLKGKKLLFVLFGLLVILGGAGWFLLGRSKGKNPEEKRERPRVVDYVALEPFVVNLKGGYNFMKVSITLEVEGKGGAEAVQKEMPAIRNQIIFLLTEKTFEEVVTAEGKKTLQKEIAQKVNSILGEGKVKVTGVYFTELIVQ